VRRAIEQAITNGASLLHDKVGPLLKGEPLDALLRGFIVRDITVMQSSFITPLVDGTPEASWRLKQCLNQLLDAECSNGEKYSHSSEKCILISADPTEMDSEVEVAKVLQSADDFSIKFCQIKLQLVFDTEKSNGGTPKGGSNSMTASLFQAIASAIERQNHAWSDLISVLGGDVARNVSLRELIFNG
jgi:mediator of RNA polymerase II transcription subunit 12, fungi type